MQNLSARTGHNNTSSTRLRIHNSYVQTIFLLCTQTADEKLFTIRRSELSVRFHHAAKDRGSVKDLVAFFLSV